MSEEGKTQDIHCQMSFDASAFVETKTFRLNTLHYKCFSPLVSQLFSMSSTVVFFDLFAHLAM